MKSFYFHPKALDRFVLLIAIVYSVFFVDWSDNVFNKKIENRIEKEHSVEKAKINYIDFVHASMCDPADLTDITIEIKSATEAKTLRMLNLASTTSGVPGVVIDFTTVPPGIDVIEENLTECVEIIYVDFTTACETTAVGDSEVYCPPNLMLDNEPENALYDYVFFTGESVNIINEYNSNMGKDNLISTLIYPNGKQIETDYLYIPAVNKSHQGKYTWVVSCLDTTCEMATEFELFVMSRLQPVCPIY